MEAPVLEERGGARQISPPAIEGALGGLSQRLNPCVLRRASLREQPRGEPQPYGVPSEAYKAGLIRCSKRAPAGRQACYIGGAFAEIKCALIALTGGHFRGQSVCFWRARYRS